MALFSLIASAALAWGHLPPTWLLKPGEPMFLINRKPPARYTVCVPEALARRHPSLEAEIDAAANVWARAIGRKVDVRFVRRNVPVAMPATGPEDRAAQHLIGCGPSVDVVVALSALRGQALGETGFKQTTIVTRRGNVKKSERHEASGRYLLLRDLERAPIKLADGTTLRWAGYPELFAAEWERERKAGRSMRDAILAKLEARDTVHYALDGRTAMLPVLVHEMGHVWGLCDLYDDGQLCDAKHAGDTRLPKNRHAMMGPMRERQQLYLADDDLAGIRALARRPGFDGGWPKTSAFPTQPAARKDDVEVFTARMTKAKGRDASIQIAVVTTKPARLRIEARHKSGGPWTDAGEASVDDVALYEPALTLNVKLGNDVRDLALRLRLEVRGAQGRWSKPRYVEL